MTDRYILSLLERTGLPAGPLESPHTLHKRGRGTKLHRVHDYRNWRTQCGVDLADTTPVTVSFLDGFSVCGKCGDGYTRAARNWLTMVTRGVEVLDLLERPSTGDVDEVAALRKVPLVLGQAESETRHCVFPHHGDLLEEWVAFRDRCTAQATARLDELVPRLGGRTPSSLRARFAAELAVSLPSDRDGRTSGIPAPWGGAYHAAAQVWCSFRSVGPSDARAFTAVYEQLNYAADRSDVVALVTDPVMSGARFRTPAEWLRAEIAAGAKRYARQLTRRWETRTVELIASADGPLRYVAFCDVMDADVGRFADSWPHCLDRNPAVAIFTGAPVVYLGASRHSGITAVDPLAAAWLCGTQHDRYGAEVHDLGPVVADGDDGRHRSLVMAEFASRWTPGRYGEFRDPHQVLALARAVTAD